MAASKFHEFNKASLSEHGVRSFRRCFSIQRWFAWSEDVLSILFAVVLALELHDLNDERELQATTSSAYYVLESILCGALLLRQFSAMGLVVLWGGESDLFGTGFDRVVATVHGIIAAACGIDLWVLTPSGQGGTLRYAMLLHCLQLDHMAALFGIEWSQNLRLGVFVTVKSLGLLSVLIVPPLFCSAIFATRFIGLGPAFADSETDEGTHNRELFGSVPRSLLTFFQVTTLDWGDIVRPSVIQEPLLSIFFVGFIMYMGIGMMNLSITLMGRLFQEEVVDEVERRKSDSFIRKMSLVLEECESSGDGRLSAEEFAEGVNNPVMRTWLARNDIRIEDPLALFELIGAGDGGSLSQEELLQGLERIGFFEKGYRFQLVINQQEMKKQVVNETEKVRQAQLEVEQRLDRIETLLHCVADKVGAPAAAPQKKEAAQSEIAAVESIRISLKTQSEEAAQSEITEGDDMVDV